VCLETIPREGELLEGQLELLLEALCLDSAVRHVLRLFVEVSSQQGVVKEHVGSQPVL